MEAAAKCVGCVAEDNAVDEQQSSRVYKRAAASGSGVVVEYVVLHHEGARYVVGHAAPHPLQSGPRRLVVEKDIVAYMRCTAVAEKATPVLCRVLVDDVGLQARRAAIIINATSMAGSVARNNIGRNQRRTT